MQAMPVSWKSEFTKGCAKLMSRWLEQRSTWQYALCIGGITFLAGLAAAAIAQWIWHGHVDISSLLGTAIGCALGVTVVALWRRVNQSQIH
jgi:hypothetical protein